jgi:ATP-dependent Lhr-like helicase
VRLFRQGYVEPVCSPPLPYHLVVQQLFAMLFQHGREMEEQVFLSTLGRIPGYAAILSASWPRISDHLIASGYLVRTGLLLSLGLKADLAFRGRGLADLCVSFDSPRSFAVMQGNILLGHVDPMSLSSRKEGPVVLALGGRSWRVASVDWSRDRVYVEPVEERFEPLAWGDSRRVQSHCKSSTRHHRAAARARQSRAYETISRTSR